MFLAPDAINVTAMDDHLLRVEFDNGEIRDFDVKAQFSERRLYKRLFEDPELFAAAHVEYGTVTWNEQLDIAPEWLYEGSVPVSREMG